MHHKVERWLLLWKVLEEFLGRVKPKTLRWVVVNSNVTFNINGKHKDRLTLCLYVVTGCGDHVLCLWHGIPVLQHIGQSITATSRLSLDMTSDVKATF